MSLDQTEILQKSPLGIVVCDKNRRISWCNPQFLADTQLTENQVVGHLYSALPLEAVDQQNQLVHFFAESHKEGKRFQHWQQELSDPVGGQVHYFTCERASSNKVSLTASKMAGLKLSSRSNWVDFLDYEVSRSRRYDNPLSVLKLHLLVFDSPEEVAEQTLQQTLKDTLADELRWADMVGKTDNGSYLVVLPETPAAALESLQQKLHASIKRQLDFVSKAVDYQLVFGQASWRKQDDSQQLLKRAREQLVAKLEALLDAS